MVVLEIGELYIILRSPRGELMICCWVIEDISVGVFVDKVN